MENVTIIIANPKRSGMNYKRAEEIMTIYEKATVIDLYKEQFQPVLNDDEFITPKADVVNYQTILSQTKTLYIIYPIWWGMMPAVLKGFFDRVFAEGFAFDRISYGLKGKMTHIETAYLVTTSNSPKWYLRFFGGNNVKKGVGKNILKASGIKKVVWYHNVEKMKFKEKNK